MRAKRKRKAKKRAAFFRVTAQHGCVHYTQLAKKKPAANVLMSLQRYRRLGLLEEVAQHYFKPAGARLEYYDAESFKDSIQLAPDEFVKLMDKTTHIMLDDGTIVDFTDAKAYLEELQLYFPKSKIKLFLESKEQVLSRIKYKQAGRIS